MNPIEQMLDQVQWKPTIGEADPNNALPYVTHQGVLWIGDIEIECVTLNDGRRLLVGPVIEEMVSALKELQNDKEATPKPFTS